MAARSPSSRRAGRSFKSSSARVRRTKASSRRANSATGGSSEPIRRYSPYGIGLPASGSAGYQRLTRMRRGRPAGRGRLSAGYSGSYCRAKSSRKKLRKPTGYGPGSVHPTEDHPRHGTWPWL